MLLSLSLTEDFAHMNYQTKMAKTHNCFFHREHISENTSYTVKIAMFEQQFLIYHCSTSYGSGHESVDVLLPGFAIIW